MSKRLSARPETALREATGAHPRTHWRNVRYHRSHAEEGELYLEVGITDDGGMESILNHADAGTRALLELAEGRTAHLTLVSQSRLGRLTVDESHADLADDELRAKIAAGLRVD